MQLLPPGLVSSLESAVLAVHAAEMMAADAAERKLEGQKNGAAATNAKKNGKALAPPKVGKATNRKAKESTARAAKAAGVGKNQAEAMAATA